jgi:LDH2 family malate/lactate/ureidoglycolate dehydrogenase
LHSIAAGLQGAATCRLADRHGVDPGGCRDVFMVIRQLDKGDTCSREEAREGDRMQSAYVVYGQKGTGSVPVEAALRLLGASTP